MQQDENDDAWNQMFMAFCSFARNLPSPPHRLIGDATRAQENDVAVVAVAWGWMQRVVRTSKAVALLGKDGYSSEAAPLRRAVLEHATRLNWAVGIGSDRLMELLLKSRAASDGKYRMAAEDGFDLDEDQLAWFTRREEEQSERYTEDAHLAHISHVFNSDPEIYGVTRQGWLWETARSHPSLDTASIYYTISEDQKVQLLDIPKILEPGRDVQQLCAYMLVATEAYMAIVGLTDSHGARLEELANRLKGLFES